MRGQWEHFKTKAIGYEGLRAFLGGLPSVVARTPQALEPYEISGWGVGAAALFMGLASQLHGWRVTVLVLPAMALLVA